MQVFSLARMGQRLTAEKLVDAVCLRLSRLHLASSNEFAFGFMPRKVCWPLQSECYASFVRMYEKALNELNVHELNSHEHELNLVRVSLAKRRIWI